MSADGTPTFLDEKLSLISHYDFQALFEIDPNSPEPDQPKIGSVLGNQVLIYKHPASRVTFSRPSPDPLPCTEPQIKHKPVGLMGC